MPRVPKQENSRVALRIRSEDKARILRAADSVPERAERLTLSEQDSLRVLNLLENVPTPNERLLRAARSLRQG